MNQLRLFINEEEIELNERSIFAITKEYENLADPTTISNDWTKTVEIPATQHNTKVFGHIFRADRVDTNGACSTGLYFNAHKKLDARIQYGADILFTGYAKMSSIKRKNGNITYNINLFGMLGKVFDIMSKITFYQTENEEEAYYIDGSQYVNEVISKDLVKSFWDADQSMSYNVSLDQAQPTDIIGFTPLNSLYPDFSAETYQAYDNTTVNIADRLKQTWEEAELDTNYDTDSLVGDGLLPRSINDFRSYYQQPFIFFNKFFDIFKAKFEEVSDYTIDIDNDWKFLPPDKDYPILQRTPNPYWANLVFLGKSLYSEGESTANAFSISPTGNVAYNISNPIQWKTSNASGSQRLFSSGVAGHTINFVGDPEYYDFSTNKFLLDEQHNIHVTGTLKYSVRVPKVTGNESIRFYNKALLSIYVTYYGENGHNEYVNTIVTRDRDKFHLAEKYTNVILVDNMEDKDANTLGWDFQINVDRLLQKAIFGDSVQIVITARWGEYDNNANIIMNTSDPFYISSASYINPVRTDSRYTTYEGVSTGTALTFNVIEGKKRSFDYFTLNDLWDRDVKPFDFLLRYCKMFGLLFKLNVFDKTITIMHRTKYFSNYTVEDWTDKLDLSQDYELKPSSYEHKYMVFNYEESDVANAQSYKEKYGVEYGSIKVDTSYAFDNESEDLFEGLKTSLTYTPTILMHENMQEQHFVFNGLSDVLINVNDDDNAAIEDLFGQFYFYAGQTYWDNNVNLPYLSDDTPVMNIQGDYMYVQKYYRERNTEYTVVTNMYSKLDVNLQKVIVPPGAPQELWKRYNYLCLFNKPQETYDTTNTYKYENGIYDIYWKKYVNEIYNNANNVLTCYLRISPYDYINFEFNHFVIIDNVLYRINKVYDYSPNNLTTKCDLVQISNIEAYTTISDPTPKPNGSRN